jgi:transposase
VGRVAGIDWAKDEHHVLVADERGLQLYEELVAHEEQQLARLCATLRRLRVERVAVERPDGLLVERLLEAGLTVLPIHPNAVKAARPRFRCQGGKSDRFDAFVLCELARTDSHRLRVLVPNSDETKALRQLTRAREDLVGARVALANQLRAQLEAFWPGAVRIFVDVDSQIALCFLERYPTPEAARALGPKRLAAFLARHGYSGRRSPEQLIARLRSAPVAPTGEAETEARRQAVLALVAALRPLVERIGLLTAEIAHAVRQHPDGAIFLSLFRDPKSVVTAARLLAEIGDCRASYPSAEALAADAGMSAVAVESGKRKHAAFRYGCDKRLRDSFATLADSTRHWHPWARRHYLDACARGHDHPRAARTVGRAWCRVVWRMWQDHTTYDPARHNALQRQLSVRG